MADPTVADGAGLAVFAVVGLLGGAHCLGMCGPLVSTYADRLAGRENAVSFREVRGHALFNLGRTASYALIGGALGLAGSLVFEAAGVLAIASTIRGVAGIAAGLAIAAAGLAYLARGTGAFPEAGLGTAGLGGLLARVTDAIGARIDDWVAGPRIALLGALHGLLPCPILYPAYLYALARGDPIEGALALGVLGLGTFPTLFLYGTAFGSLAAGTRSRLHRALGVAFLLLAYLPLSMGLASLGVDLPRVGVPIYQPLAGLSPIVDYPALLDLPSTVDYPVFTDPSSILDARALLDSVPGSVPGGWST